MRRRDTARDRAAAAERTLPCDPTSAAYARRFVREVAEGWGLREVDSLVLLVSELVTNALLHARSEVRIRIERLSDRMRVTVSDSSERAPTRQGLTASAVTGRGLELVELLALDWGVRTGPGGKGVWFELPLIDTAGDDDVAAHAT